MKKQVIAATTAVATSAALLAHVSIEGEASPAPAAENSITETTPKTTKSNLVNSTTAPATGPSNLFISVKTFDVEGKTVGERIVDMYHFGTRNWLQNHHWWAMHNSHCVETNVASQDEITTYLAASKVALAAKFNAPKAQVAA